MFIAPDEAAMRALADTVPLFRARARGADLPGLGLPALRPRLARRCASWPSGWRRCTRCRRKRDRPQLLVTTVNAATQRMLTPFRIRQLVAPARAGRADRPRPAGRAAAAPMAISAPTRSRDAGEFAVRGVDRRPVPGGRGAGAAARFLRRRDRERAPLRSRRPAQHRPDRRLHPAAGVRGPARRGQRSSASAPRYRERSAPMRPAIRSTRRCATGGGWPGMEHWLPLFEEQLATLFDHLGDDDVIVRDAGDAGAPEARLEAIDDYFANRERAMVGRAGQLPPARPGDALSCAQGMATRGRGAADPPRRRPSRSPKAPGHRLRRRRAARLRAGARAERQCLRSGRRSMSPSFGSSRQEGRARQLLGRRARAACRACSTTMASRA